MAASDLSFVTSYNFVLANEGGSIHGVLLTIPQKALGAPPQSPEETSLQLLVPTFMLLRAEARGFCAENN